MSTFSSTVVVGASCLPTMVVVIESLKRLNATLPWRTPRYPVHKLLPTPDTKKSSPAPFLVIIPYNHLPRVLFDSILLCAWS
jgi:hypothetical protein